MGEEKGKTALFVGKCVLFVTVFAVVIVGCIMSSVTVGTFVLSMTGNKGISLICALGMSVGLMGGLNHETERLIGWLFGRAKP